MAESERVIDREPVRVMTATAVGTIEATLALLVVLDVMEPAVAAAVGVWVAAVAGVMGEYARGRVSPS